MSSLILWLILFFAIAAGGITIWKKKLVRRNCIELLDKAEKSTKEGKVEEAHRILNRIELSSRYDELGQKANFLSANCLEQLGNNLEASYEYATYLAKFPKGIYSRESKQAFKRLWTKFGPFDFKKLEAEDSCGFAMTEKTIKELTL